MQVRVGDMLRCSYNGGEWHGWVVKTEEDRVEVWRPQIPFTPFMTFTLQFMKELRMEVIQ